MRQFTIIIFLLGLFSCGENSNSTTDKQQLKTQLVDDTIIYEFINFILHPKDSDDSSVHSDKIEDSNEMLFRPDSLTLVKMDSIFTTEDIKYIYEQLNTIKDFKLNPKFLPDKILISADTLKSMMKNGVDEFWDNYRKKFGQGGFYTITMPLFSKDKSTVIIDYGYHCGSLCGYGAIFIYKKKNGKWTLIHELEGWIS